MAKRMLSRGKLMTQYECEIGFAGKADGVGEIKGGIGRLAGVGKDGPAAVFFLPQDTDCGIVGLLERIAGRLNFNLGRRARAQRDYRLGLARSKARSFRQAICRAHLPVSSDRGEPRFERR